MIREPDRVVLTVPVAAHGLEAGDIGTVVLIHEGGAGYEVEFVKLDGETHAVTTLRSDHVRPIDPNEIAHARVLAA